jgi:hypothetical protein
MERYEYRDGCYVLFVGGMPAAQTERVALLVDAERGRLVTHGDPRSVRAELDALRAVEPERTAAWLLLEGRPALAALNRALDGDVNIHDLHLAFTQASAQRLAGELIARLRSRRMT